MWRLGVSVSPRGPPEPVINLEVQLEHVYRVGDAGVLVHNGGIPFCSEPVELKPRLSGNRARRDSDAIHNIITNNRKKPKSKISEKQGAKDKPSWVNEHPYAHENGNDFAKRLLDEKYGPGSWKKGSNTEFNKIRKWADRAFE